MLAIERRLKTIYFILIFLFQRMGFTTRGGTRPGPSSTEVPYLPCEFPSRTRRGTAEAAIDDIIDDARNAPTFRAARLMGRDKVGPLGGTRDGQSDLTARRVDCGATTAVSSNLALVELNAGGVSLSCMPRVLTDVRHV